MSESKWFWRVEWSIICWFSFEAIFKSNGHLSFTNQFSYLWQSLSSTPPHPVHTYLLIEENPKSTLICHIILVTSAKFHHLSSFMYVINNPIKHNLNEFPPNCGHRLLYVGWRRLGKVISKSKRELFIISHQSYLIFKVVSVFFVHISSGLGTGQYINKTQASHLIPGWSSRLFWLFWGDPLITRLCLGVLPWCKMRI